MPAGRPGRRGAGGRAVRRAAGTLLLTALLLLVAAGGGRRGGAAAAPGEDPARCPEDRFVDVEEVPGFTEGRKRQGGCACKYLHISELTEELFHYNSERRIPMVVRGALNLSLTTGLWNSSVPLREDLEGMLQAQDTDVSRTLEEFSDPCRQAEGFHVERGGGKRGKKLREFLKGCVAWDAARTAWLANHEAVQEETGRYGDMTIKDFLAGIFDPVKGKAMYGEYRNIYMQIPKDGLHPTDRAKLGSYEFTARLKGLRDLVKADVLPDWLRWRFPSDIAENEDYGDEPTHVHNLQQDWGVPTLLIGADGSRTPPHTDGCGWTPWVGVVKGTKLLYLWPTDSDHLGMFGQNPGDNFMFGTDIFNRVPPQLQAAWERTGRSFMDSNWDTSKYTSFSGDGGGGVLPAVAPGQCLVKEGEFLIGMDAIHSVINIGPTLAFSADQLDRYGVAAFVWRKFWRLYEKFWSQYDIIQASGQRRFAEYLRDGQASDGYERNEEKVKQCDTEALEPFNIYRKLLRRSPEFGPTFLKTLVKKAKAAQAANGPTGSPRPHNLPPGKEMQTVQERHAAIVAYLGVIEARWHEICPTVPGALPELREFHAAVRGEWTPAWTPTEL